MFKSTRNTNRLSVVSFAVFFAVAIASAQAPDNTTNNKEHQVTADQQSNSTPDMVITQKIRKALTADKSLSTYAHNVKIITANGVVTLKGPVLSEDEKKAVVSKASEVVPSGNINNQVTVKAQ